MATTFQQVINWARLDLNDDDKTRHPDAILIKYANNYVQEAIKMRPDLFFREAINLPSSDFVLTDTFPMTDRYLRSCSDYIIGRAKMRGTEESNMAEASAYLQLSAKEGGI
jgi:hypothetical protein